jgi:hypothetical protein
VGVKTVIIPALGGTAVDFTDRNTWGGLSVPSLKVMAAPGETLYLDKIVVEIDDQIKMYGQTFDLRLLGLDGSVIQTVKYDSIKSLKTRSSDRRYFNTAIAGLARSDTWLLEFNYRDVFKGLDVFRMVVGGASPVKGIELTIGADGDREIQPYSGTIAIPTIKYFCET